MGFGPEVKPAMKRTLRVVPLGMLALLVMLTAGCSKLKARDQLNKGVQAYKNAKYEEAIEKFKNAVALDPDLGVAKLYLATAYVGQYVPGLDTPENIRNAELAIEQYQEVLKANPNPINKLTAMKGIASLYFNMKKFDQSKEWYNKVLQQDPNDAETYYSIGVIDWTEAYAPRMEERNKLGLKPEQALYDKKNAKVCEDLKTKNSADVQEGIDELNKAMNMRADYDDAMAYMNLMYREKADIDCGDDAARQADLKTADDWVDKTMATKRAKAEKQNKPGGIVMEDQQQQK